MKIPTAVAIAVDIPSRVSTVEWVVPLRAYPPRKRQTNRTAIGHLIAGNRE
ncbi:hypothetical protein NG799_24620 [Laspinema sp. D1]|uniref:Transposase n=1 Tax=Laspinema palackyanum D2a TaxID=2953684 RepID=A0ABT2N1J3_9CYAN|nr:hypothetical protein [Laspinema sp. D2a]